MRLFSISLAYAELLGNRVKIAAYELRLEDTQLTRLALAVMVST